MMYNIDDLINNFGLREHIKEDLFTKTLDWYDVLNAKGVKKELDIFVQLCVMDTS
jgi:hypothetical protein